MDEVLIVREAEAKEPSERHRIDILTEELDGFDCRDAGHDIGVRRQIALAGDFGIRDRELILERDVLVGEHEVPFRPGFVARETRGLHRQHKRSNGHVVAEHVRRQPGDFRCKNGLVQ